MIAALVTGVAAAGIVTVPGTRIETYPVSGGDVAAIRASLAERGPIDRNDGVRVAAITHWRYRWRWPGTAGGPCRLSDATVRFSATVTLPRLVGVTALPPGVQAEWRRYRNALAAHEGNHLHRAYTHRGEVLIAAPAVQPPARRRARCCAR